MKAIKRPLQLVATALACACISRATGEPELRNLGVLPDGTLSWGRAISANGSVVTGWCDLPNGIRHAYRWAMGGGMQDLGVLPNGGSAFGTGISSNGSVVTGWADQDGQSHLFRWTPIGGMQSVATWFPGGLTASCTNANGSAIAGQFNYATGTAAIVWRAEQGVQYLASHPEQLHSWAYAMNASGSVIVGNRILFTSPQISTAVRWTASGNVQELGVVPGYTSSFAQAISADGSTVAGFSAYNPAPYSQAFSWTQKDGIVPLGFMPGGITSHALGISADGSTIVGSGNTVIGNDSGTHAFVWTRKLGMVDLHTFLPSLGVDITGWVLYEAVAVSADGTAILGNGSYNSGSLRAFLVTGLPGTTNCRADFNHDGIVGSQDFFEFLIAFFGELPTADFNYDGSITSQDFFDFLAAFLSPTPCE